jgi:DNA repair photolyase
MSKIGITERGDAAVNLEWIEWVSQGNPAILITKNPKELIGYLDGNENVIIHCTVTGLGGTKLEPNVPSVDESAEAMKTLSELFDKDRIVLRIDPIVPYEPYLSKHLEAYEKCMQYASRLRVSFMDMYPHVIARLQENKLRVPYQTLHAPLQDRLEALAKFPNAEVCGEPGIACKGCVSPEDCFTLKVLPEPAKNKQRQACACIGNKKELLNSKKPCLHGCLYCYWR